MSNDTKQRRRKVLFSFTAEPGSKVTVAGTFNDWDPKATKLKEKAPGQFERALLVKPGKHEYKFVVNDEQWVIDAENTNAEVNEHGTLNSVIEVLEARRTTPVLA